VWNSTEWISKSSTIYLESLWDKNVLIDFRYALMYLWQILESVYPSLTVFAATNTRPITNGSTVTISLNSRIDINCVGMGIPLPEVQFDSVKNVSQRLCGVFTVSQIND